MKSKLLHKIENREIIVGVIGLGYVGLPLAVEKAKAGFKTIGFDVQKEKVDLVNTGHNYIGDVVDSDLKKLVDAGTLSATTDFSFVKDVDFHCDLRSYPTRCPPAARYQLCKSFYHRGCQISYKRNYGRFGVYHISRNNRRTD